ncbi:MAG: hypothetical protein ACTMUB_04000 [cyanobacterium endosymbiont of Rhopalodia musculus]
MLNKFFEKSKSDKSGYVTPRPCLSERFPALIYGDIPQVNLQDWEFLVWKLATPKIFSWSADLMKLSYQGCTKDFHRVTF